MMDTGTTLIGTLLLGILLIASEECGKDKPKSFNEFRDESYHKTFVAPRPSPGIPLTDPLESEPEKPLSDAGGESHYCYECECVHKLGYPSTYDPNDCKAPGNHNWED